MLIIPALWLTVPDKRRIDLTKYAVYTNFCGSRFKKNIQNQNDTLIPFLMLGKKLHQIMYWIKTYVEQPNIIYVVCIWTSAQCTVGAFESGLQRSIFVHLGLKQILFTAQLQKNSVVLSRVPQPLLHLLQHRENKLTEITPLSSF